MLKEFKQFLVRGNVVDLAIGVVIGASFSALVNALVKDILTPLIAAIAKKPDFSGIFFVLNGNKFLYGDFLNALISFGLIAFTVFFSFSRLRFLTMASASTMAFRVVALGTLTSKGRRCSSATRSRSSRMASEMDRPMASRASVARFLVRVSMRARTKVSAVLMGNLPKGGFAPTLEV